MDTILTPLLTVLVELTFDDVRIIRESERIEYEKSIASKERKKKQALVCIRKRKLNKTRLLTDIIMCGNQMHTDHIIYLITISYF